MKALLYCTKNKPYLCFDNKYCIHNKDHLQYWALNGKIVGEFDYDVEEIFNVGDEYEGLQLYTETLSIEEVLKKSCLSYKDYLGYVSSAENYGYAIYIKNLKIFDKPRELAHSTTDNDSYYYTEKYDKKFKTIRCGALIQAPRNMMYVFDSEGKKVLIPFHSELLCKILNGECTIIFKKKILKEML